MIYGYARVSTDGQSVDPQVKQLRAAVDAPGAALDPADQNLNDPGLMYGARVVAQFEFPLLTRDGRNSVLAKLQNQRSIWRRSFGQKILLFFNGMDLERNS